MSFVVSTGITNLPLCIVRNQLTRNCLCLVDLWCFVVDIPTNLSGYFCALEELQLSIKNVTLNKVNKLSRG